MRTRSVAVRFPLAALALVAAVLAALPARAQVLHENLWVTNGTVWATVASGEVIYLGGGFSQVGPATGGWVGIDATTGTAPAPFPLVSGSVLSAAPDGSGGWYIGGLFTAARGQPRNSLAHLDAAGNVTA
jgi:hypothetical protein